MNLFALSHSNFRNKPLVVALSSSAVHQPQTLGQRLRQKILAPLQIEPRRQMLQEVERGRREPSAAEKQMNRHFAIASINLGIAAASIVFQPLLWLTVPISAYSLLPFVQLAYKSLRKERRVTSYVLDLVLLGGTLLCGYFYTTVFNMWLSLLARKLLLHSEHNARQNLASLFEEQPRTVWVLTREGIEVEIPLERLQIHDVIVISAGQVIPVDGLIVAGAASIDQRKLTGESQPAEKGVGDAVLAATVVLTGRIQVRTERAGVETVAIQIGQILDQTAAFKNSIQARAEALANQLVLPTLGVSFLCLPLGAGSALAVLTNKPGFKMRLFSPVSMLSFLNLAAHQGILIKDGRSLELLQTVDTIVFDKTGTLTLEQPTVSKIHLCLEAEQRGLCEDDILRYAAAAEVGQSHPIARAILATAQHSCLEYPKIEDAAYEVGYGIRVKLASGLVRVGSLRFMEMETIAVSSSMRQIEERDHAQGHSLVMVAVADQLIGAIELQATVRPEAQTLIAALQRRGMATYIISGDQEAPTRQLAQALGIQHYFANTLPENKAALVEQLQQQGKSVCFIGDGINDAIALKKANVSISLRGATTVATDTAQVVLMDGTLRQVEPLFALVHNFAANMKNNLLIAFLPGVVCLGGILFLHWGVTAGLMITQATNFVGISNAALPLLKRQFAATTESSNSATVLVDSR